MSSRKEGDPKGDGGGTEYGGDQILLSMFFYIG
jgi:hypothetical protein